MKYKVYPDFLNKEECEHLIDLTNKRMTQGWSPDPVTFKPVKSTAQCNNLIAYCRKGDTPIVDKILDRISTTLDISTDYFEPVQLLKYEQFGYYRRHIDNSNPGDENPRKFTFQIYLNDVEEGGETRFPELNIQFKPKAGKAVWWENFTDDKRGTADLDTIHEGILVKKGFKFSATEWIKLHPLIKKEMVTL